MAFKYAPAVLSKFLATECQKVSSSEISNGSRSTFFTILISEKVNWEIEDVVFSLPNGIGQLKSICLEKFR
jgi:hypothetical protein